MTRSKKHDELRELIQNLIQCGQIETIHHVVNQTLAEVRAHAHRRTRCARYGKI